MSRSPIPNSLRMTVTLGYINEKTYTSKELINQIKPLWVISHVLQGRIELVTFGHSFVACAGDVMIHPPHLPYDEISEGPCATQWLLVDLKMSDSIDIFRHYPLSPVVRLENPKEFRRRFAELKEEWLQLRALRDLRLCALTTDLITMVLQQGINEQTSEGGDQPSFFLQEYERFSPVIHYMETHLRDKISRDELASIVNLHPVYFDRSFAAIYNISPMGYLRDLRLSKAQSLLAETDYSLEAIAEQCGMNDAAYLSKVFRNRFGQSPGEYRKSLKNTTTRLKAAWSE